MDLFDFEQMVKSVIALACNESTPPEISWNLYKQIDLRWKVGKQSRKEILASPYRCVYLPNYLKDGRDL